jgi:hypothetical protein
MKIIRIEVYEIQYRDEMNSLHCINIEEDTFYYYIENDAGIKEFHSPPNIFES